MKNNSSGFVSAQVIFILSAVCISLLALHFFVDASLSNTKTYKNYYKNKDESKKILNKVVSELQELKFEEADFNDSDLIKSICTEYSDYDLKITDCSSGINQLFFKEDFLKNEKIQNLINYKSDTVIKEYGWINKKWSDEETRLKIMQESPEEAMIIINTLPLINIFMCDPELVDVIAEYCGVKDYDKKRPDLNELIMLKTFSKKKACEILKINESNTFFDILGVKTTFWKINFNMSGNITTAIVAAIPGSEGKIKKYKIIEMYIRKK